MNNKMEQPSINPIEKSQSPQSVPENNPPQVSRQGSSLTLKILVAVVAVVTVAVGLYIIIRERNNRNYINSFKKPTEEIIPVPAFEYADSELMAVKLAEEKNLKDDLKVKFLDVLEDTRCPIGVDCLTIGTAVLDVEFSYGSDKQRKQLTIQGSSFLPSSGKLIALVPTPENETQIGLYSVLLAGLEPYPVMKSLKNKTKYQAFFAVTTQEKKALKQKFSNEENMKIVQAKAEKIAMEAVKKSYGDIDPGVIGGVKQSSNIWRISLFDRTNRSDLKYYGYWVSVDATDEKVLKIIPLRSLDLGGEVTLGLDEGAIFERGGFIVAAETVSKLIMEDPFDEVYNVKVEMADSEEYSESELWLSSTGATEKGKDKLSWKGYSIQVITADENVPFVTLVVNKLGN